jgi:hypothetical protein
MRAQRYNHKRKAEVAQLVEQLIRNQQVVGSSPTFGSIQVYGHSKNSFQGNRAKGLSTRRGPLPYCPGFTLRTLREVAFTRASLIMAIVTVKINGTKRAVLLEIRRCISQGILAAQFFFDAAEAL